LAYRGAQSRAGPDSVLTVWKESAQAERELSGDLEDCHNPLRTQVHESPVFTDKASSEIASSAETSPVRPCQKHLVLYHFGEQMHIYTHLRFASMPPKVPNTTYVRPRASGFFCM